MATQVMGRDTQRATSSGYNWPIRLGTSSPNKMVTKVMIVTTMAVADTSPARCEIGNVTCNHAESPSLNAASPTMPLSMPIEVMPTCTDDRNCVGFFSSSKAAWAPLSPASAMVCKRIFRLAVSASSDMAKAPLSSVSKMMSRISMEPEAE